MPDWDLEGWWFKPQCNHYKIHAAVGPWARPLTPHCSWGDWPLLSQINCTLLWIKVSASRIWHSILFHTYYGIWYQFDICHWFGLVPDSSGLQPWSWGTPCVCWFQPHAFNCIKAQNISNSCDTHKNTFYFINIMCKPTAIIQQIIEPII